MKLWVPQDRLESAEQLYFKKVILNLQWITENHSNRKLLANWWDDNVSAEMAELLNVDRKRLCEAFREAFGG
ncbi:hypothetical protein [Paenibacillus abyssi]|uniref:Uncharacterized protein n=1 Tax=Paenibacillus abyssi TaxID=1340531 RepID=A0A917FQZ5_9BACL|nr:hypothetical protein [Paenibacillus abyssi]GGF95753.1 hypothetical protein GCM10010916_11330 [Paenibacillus abyssi]